MGIPKYPPMLNKTLISNFNTMQDNDTLTYDTSQSRQFSKTNLAESLLKSLQDLQDKYDLVLNYYSGFTITNDFCLNTTLETKS